MTNATMKKLLLTICISCVYLFSFGQITTLDSNFEKSVPINKEDIIVTIPYDSLNDISKISLDDLKFSRGLIGQQLYFPKTDNPIQLFTKDLIIQPLKSAGVHREITLNNYITKDISYFFPDAVLLTNIYHYNDNNIKSDSIVQDKYYKIVGFIEFNSNEYNEIIMRHTPDLNKYRIFTKIDYKIEKDLKGRYYSLEDNYFKHYFDKTLAINSIVDIRPRRGETILKLVDSITGDTLYTSDKGILVGFFSKVQQVYQNKIIVWQPSSNDTEIQDYVTKKRFTVEDVGTEFKCKSITLYKDEIIAILENEKGKITQQIGKVLNERNRPHCITEKKWEYYRHTESSLDQIVTKIPSSNLPVQPIVLTGDDFNRNLEFKDYLIAYENYIKDVDRLLKDFNKRNKEQEELEWKNFELKKAKEENSRLQACISKYGQKFGPDIAKRNVILGMTKEMCVAAWGKPSRTHIESNNLKTVETWIYNSISNLYVKYVVLVNNIVCEIGK